MEGDLWPEGAGLVVGAIVGGLIWLMFILLVCGVGFSL